MSPPSSLTRHQSTDIVTSLMSMSDKSALDGEEDLLQRVDRTPVVTTVMTRLRALIDSERLRPGDRLPSEHQLREQLGVGRSTIREALRALEALGLVEIRHGQGTLVRRAPEPPSPPGMGPEDIEALDTAQLGPLVEARLAIEPFAAALAAQRRTPEQLPPLETALAVFDEAMDVNDHRALVMADVSFHAEIAAIANPLLDHCLRDFGVLLINSRHITLGRTGTLASVSQRHRGIYNAIALGDSRLAYDAMSKHLTDFAHHLELTTVEFRDGTYLIDGTVAHPQQAGAKERTSSGPRG